MLYPSMDPNERFRARRDTVRRRKRRRRAAVAAILLLVVLAVAGGMTLAGKSDAERLAEGWPGRRRRRGVAPGRHPATAAPGRGARRPRDRRARVTTRKGRGVRQAHEARPQHDRARHQGRGRRDRLQAVRCSSRAKDGRAPRLLQAARGCEARAPERRLPDRPRRRLPGPVPRQHTARPRNPSHRRLDLEDARTGSPG